MENGRICLKCGVWKPYTNFYIRDKEKQLYGSQCKPCIIKASVAWQKNNRGVVNAIAKKYRDTHHDRVLESLRQWKLKNPLWNKQYKESHQDEIREYNQEYSAREDVKIGRAVRERKRQARKNGAEYPLTVKEWLWILEICGYTCLRCGAVANITQDHMIPLSRGGNHSADNVQPLCLSCNSSKYDTAIDYRSAWVRKLVEEYINGNRWRGLQLRGKAQQEYQAAQTQV